MTTDSAAPGPSAAGYGAAAAQLAEQYESVSFEEVHRAVHHLYPRHPSTVLDVGAGSGRDAAALAALGHTVTAAEPTAELRALGRRLHAGRAIDWVDDALPGLPVLTARPSRFELVLLTAVWMHLDAAERAVGFASLAALLRPRGRLVLSLRHGPVPPGRRMFEVTAAETLALAAEHALTPLHRAERADLHGRPGVSWTWLAFEAA
ncbi:SAM-dependent methyltransferase [Streptomyces tateyamensis]|uniref:SAM-dependent methyltransferase n=1 Tax=Streptomyces tateyamensis TaxID=565073 RepID=A0A2V4NH07_9ACTN|nr:methyltransferase domain-containing protein [Streptomyces tateyamensis]PYC84738.1 SAM-dependent methyltransferase [Streptomyces tateyamensis]